MKAIILRLMAVAVLLQLAHASLAQAQQIPEGNAVGASTGQGLRSSTSLVGTLEGTRSWKTADFKQRTGGVKVESVQIENGTGTGRFFGYGPGGRCSSVSDVPAQLTLDASGVLTVVANAGDCGIWEYTLQRVGPTTFKGRHRINPTEIILEFTPR